VGIEAIKRRYKNEWLLIEVSQTDRFGRPLAGKLISHSKKRDQIYKKQRRLKGNLYIVYSGKIPAKGYAVAFSW